MNSKTVFFIAPGEVELREQSLRALGENEVLAETIVSAISAGTEMLVYRGQVGGDVDPVDQISSGLHYPTPYGYACIGRVIEIGPAVDRNLAGRLIFSFQPHTSHFLASATSLLPIPDDISPDTACFLPSMETAVNLVQDAAPILGERVLVLGQGVVGLLTTALLREYPLHALVTADYYPLRRKSSLELQVTASLDPKLSGFYDSALSHCQDILAPRRDIEVLPQRGGFDLAFELSGNPAALNDAISLAAFSGRIVIGSWYGNKQALIDLGGAFHRSRIRLISSQVSTIAPELSARWDKARRFDVAWNMLRRTSPERWITHRFPLDQAAHAYRLLDSSPAQAIQVIFKHQ
jgi:2-desacetyl-2-hydroxyethyl bacteriochlorophyllide A dehydrogenase